MSNQDAKVHKETYMTFMGWVDKGRGVKKGEKAVAFITDEDGKRTGLFGKSQTVKLEYRDLVTGRNSCWDGDTIYDAGQGVWLRQLTGPKRQDVPYPMPRMG